MVDFQDSKNAEIIEKSIEDAKRKAEKDKHIINVKRNYRLSKSSGHLVDRNTLESGSFLDSDGLGATINDINSQEDEEEFMNLPYIISDEVAISVGGFLWSLI